MKNYIARLLSSGESRLITNRLDRLNEVVDHLVSWRQSNVPDATFCSGFMIGLEFKSFIQEMQILKNLV